MDAECAEIVDTIVHWLIASVPRDQRADRLGQIAESYRRCFHRCWPLTPDEIVEDQCHRMLAAVAARVRQIEASGGKAGRC